MILLIEQLLNGLQLGTFLFLLSAGLTLIFGIMGVINLAHGSLYMVGAYAAALGMQWTGSFWWGLLMALPAAAFMGCLVELVIIRQLYLRNNLDHVLATFGLILFLDATTPPIYNKMGVVGWVPTLSLTSHIRRMPSEGPLKVIAKTEFITNNFMEEDREIWDSKGFLVGQSKQLAKLRIRK